MYKLQKYFCSLFQSVFKGIYTMNKLHLKWSISKAQDTFGYNRLTLTSENGDKFVTVGGGYDMIGTVLAMYLEKNYQLELKGISDRAYYDYDSGTKTLEKNDYKYALYGMTAIYKGGYVRSVSLDGACGLTSVKKIASTIGLDIEEIYNRDRKGRPKNLIAFVY